jgi:hypothetical protein
MLEFFRIHLDIQGEEKALEKKKKDKKLKKRESLTPSGKKVSRFRSRTLAEEPYSSEKISKFNDGESRKLNGNIPVKKIRKLKEDSDSENVITFETSEERRAISPNKRFSTDGGNDEKIETPEVVQKSQFSRSKTSINKAENSMNGLPDNKKKKQSNRKGRIERLSRTGFDGNEEEYHARSPDIISSKPIL